MKQRKPRTKEQSQWMQKVCPYFDGQSLDGSYIHECLYPWSDRCDGNRHKCFKLKLHWFASLSDKKRKTMQEKYGY